MSGGLTLTVGNHVVRFYFILCFFNVLFHYYNFLQYFFSFFTLVLISYKFMSLSQKIEITNLAGFIMVYS